MNANEQRQKERLPLWPGVVLLSIGLMTYGIMQTVGRETLVPVALAVEGVLLLSLIMATYGEVFSERFLLGLFFFTALVLAVCSGFIFPARYAVISRGPMSFVTNGIVWAPTGKIDYLQDRTLVSEAKLAPAENGKTVVWRARLRIKITKELDQVFSLVSQLGIQPLNQKLEDLFGTVLQQHVQNLPKEKIPTRWTFSLTDDEVKAFQALGYTPVGEVWLDRAQIYNQGGNRQQG